MENITSRKNSIITHIRALSKDRAYRSLHGEYVCDGIKQLKEAVSAGADIGTVIWRGNPELAADARQIVVSAELLSYVSPLKNSPGPVFTIKIPNISLPESLHKVIILENVQDPGNVGTVIRTANAFDIDAVILTGGCADLYSPKTVRSAMGALFVQPVLELSDITGLLRRKGMRLWGAALEQGAADIRSVPLEDSAVVIGNEGSGLSDEMKGMCTGFVKIPMSPAAESLNAAVAASVVMWEMSKLSL